MKEVKIYTIVSDQLSPPITGESFCTDMVRHSDYADLEEKCAALAAENAGLKKSEVEFNEYCRRECEDVGDTWVDDFTETPATDAFLAEVRAQGVEMFADKYRAQLTALPTTPENIFDAAHVSLRYQIFDADEFAAQLRKEAAQ
ncbi:ead/Ea22-like family protein [Salmonella enterica subsp. enterica serovar Montevideo]|uniref:hypothetical protein n=1 Tax=Salmonella enterica TaxID=28901 RepID=UPI0003BDA44E|nr:hypothetical protein [Salmonella enterica]ESG35033.1 Eae protein [Salmonella enterica subsp. enterica serovar Montevideo str. 8387]SUE55324.1 Eae protein [Salmonella enterica subsp. enterica serovar Montevideo]